MKALLAAAQAGRVRMTIGRASDFFGAGVTESTLGARIFAVADSFDAMTTHRPYQSAMEPAKAIEQIIMLTSRKFDPQVAAALETVFKAGQLRVSRVAALA